MIRHLFVFVGFMCATCGWSAEEDIDIFSAFDLDQKDVTVVNPRIKQGGLEPLVVTEERAAKATYDGPVITSLVFVSDPNLAKYKNHLDLQEIDFIDLVVPDEKSFRSKMGEHIKKPLTMEELNAIQIEVTKFYVNNGKPLVRVIVPAEQDVTDGKVFVVVLKGKLGKVRIQGEKYCNPNHLKKQIKTAPGSEISTSQMATDISWLNNDPFRSVDLIYERGEDLGTTDVILDVKDRIPFQAYGGYENSGYQSAGSSRYTVGFKSHTFIFPDHQLNGQLVFANNFEKWWSISGNYLAPLPNRHTFKAFGCFVKSLPDGASQEIIENPDLRGKLWQVGVRYIIPLDRKETYTHNVSFGYDFKRTNNFTNVAGALIFDEYFDISQFLFRYEGDNEDKWGTTSYGSTFYFSPGHMTPYNDKTSYKQVNLHSDPCYLYGLVNLDRITYFPGDWSWSFHSLFQWSTEADLLPTEQLSLGGQFSIRGYKENEVIGSSGVLGIMEFRSPPLAYLKNRGGGGLQFLIFTDAGYTWQADRNLFYDAKDDKSDRTKSLWSVGPGIRYNYRSYVTFRFDYGFQLKSVNGRFMGEGRDNRLHLGLFVSY